MGELIFGKWVLTAAFVFGGQVQDFPILRQVTAPVPQIEQRIALPTVIRVECPPVPVGVVAPPCSPEVLLPVPGFQAFCLAPGVYTVSVRLGLLAPWGAAGGKVWIEGRNGRELVAAFTAAPGAPAHVAASLQVADPMPTCYLLKVETSAPVEAIADQAVSFVTIGR